MTEFIFFSAPWLLAAPLSVFVISAVCAVNRNRFFGFLNVIMHICAICALIYFGGGLSDVFITMLMSCLAFSVFGKNEIEYIDSDKEVDGE